VLIINISPTVLDRIRRASGTSATNVGLEYAVCCAVAIRVVAVGVSIQVVVYAVVAVF